MSCLMAVPAMVDLLLCRKGLFLDVGELIGGDHDGISPTDDLEIEPRSESGER